MASRPKTVAYLGPPSSYTHQAALEDFSHDEYSLEPRASLQDIFTAVQSSSATYGVVPFENSTNGSVVYTLDLFADRQNQYPDVYICGEAYLDVHHYLLGRHPAKSLISTFSALQPPQQQEHEQGQEDTTATANTSTPTSTSRTATPTPLTPSPHSPRSSPLTSLAHITRVYTHPQAFGQCECFLSTYLKHAERQEVSSTSKAAEIVSQDKTRTSAAISSKVAAGVHGLDVLAKGIEDRDDNTTRFFFLRRTPGTGPGESSSQSQATISTSSSSSCSDRLLEDSAAQQSNTAIPPSTLSSIQPLTFSQTPFSNFKTKTLLSFTIPHKTPGALADALTVFKTCGLNLTSINSRPSRLRNWHYIFFVEFESLGQGQDRRVRKEEEAKKEREREGDPGEKEGGEGKNERSGGGQQDQQQVINDILKQKLDEITEGWRWFGTWNVR